MNIFKQKATMGREAKFSFEFSSIFVQTFWFYFFNINNVSYLSNKNSWIPNDYADVLETNPSIHLLLSCC